MNTKLSQSILKKISEKNIRPKNRWHFIIARAVLWVPGIVSILVGALATSALIYVVSHAGWQYAPFVSDDSLWKYALTTLPYLWIALVILFTGLVYSALRKTRRGYRYHTMSLVFGSILLSILLGSVGYALGIGQAIDTGLGARVRGFDSLVQQRTQQWSHPEHGRLVGEVKKIGNTSLRLKDPDGYFWSVDTRSLEQREASLLNTILDQHRQVRILGYLDENFPNTFHACLMLPVYPPRPGDGIEPPAMPFGQMIHDPLCGEVLRLNPPMKGIPG